MAERPYEDMNFETDIVPLLTVVTDQAEDIPPDDAPEEVVDAYASGLPPREFWLRDPEDKIPTPQDSRGIIDVPKLIAVVNSTIHPSYRWRPGLSRHHIYWTRQRYVDHVAERPDSMALKFREHRSNKIRVYKEFENWLHVITEPPFMPEEDVMRNMCDAWLAAQRAFKAVRAARHTIRMLDRDEKRRRLDGGPYDEVQRGIADRMLQRDLRGVAKHVGALGDVPVEYWPLNPDERAWVSAGRIGCVLVQGAQRRTRAVYLRDVA